MPKKYCVVLLLFVALGTSAAALAETEEEISALIARLDHPRYTDRERAARRLQQLGMDAWKQLEEAATSENLEIRRRAQWLLRAMAEAVLQARLEAFVKGDSNVPLPGWKRYSELIGDSTESRALFFKMQEAQHPLLELYEETPDAVGDAILRMSEAVQQHRQEFSIGSMAALLLVLGDEQVEIADESLTQVIVLFRNAGFAESLTGNDGKVMQTLLGNCITRPSRSGDLGTTTARLALALEYNYHEEALELAVDFLRQSRELQNQGGWGDNHSYLVHTVGRFGNRTYIPLLERALDEPNGTVPVQDIALNAMIHLAGQHSEDYGFAQDFPNQDWNRTGWNQLGLKDPSTREASLAKWRAWAKENLKPGTEYVPDLQGGH